MHGTEQLVNGTMQRLIHHKLLIASVLAF